MTLCFITGNKKKFDEAQAILGGLERREIELPEIQDINPRNIISAKLREALHHQTGEFIIDDTSLHLECLNGLPGPLIKWFLKTVGAAGLHRLAEKLGNDRAEARAIIGYARSHDDIHYFEGTVTGRIVAPRGATQFGWDPVFQPDGSTKTYAEMTADEKNAISHRRKALDKLKEFLAKR